MALWARSKFGATMFEPDVFRKQMHFSEQMHHSDSAPGALRPLDPSLCACWVSRFNYEKSRLIFFYMIYSPAT